MSENDMEPVVKIRSGYKKYGRGKAAQTVLNNFNMTIKRGTM